MPSRKVLSFFVLIVGLVAAIIVGFGRDKSSQIINQASNLVGGSSIVLPENPDWQNELNQVGLDELKVATQTNTPETSGVATTITDQVAKNLVGNYLVLKQNDALSQKSAEDLVNQTLSSIEKSANSETVNIKLLTIPDNGIQTITDYGHNLGNLLKRNRPTYKTSEMDVVKEALQTNNKDKLKELQPIITFLKNFSREMRLVIVPQKFVKSHTDMILGIEGAILGLEETSFVLDDPVRGLKGLQIYGQGAVLLSRALGSNINYISSNKIEYKQGSGGYYLLHGI